MAIEGLIRGQDAIWDDERNCWLWVDTGELAEGGDGSYRPCLQCARIPEPCPRGCSERHDPCLGHIEDALSCCCGHGLFVGHVNWPGLSVPAYDGWHMSVKRKE